ncbi:N-acetylneuraminate synthase family protein [Thalassospira sp. MIT1370]|uniref:N-acetylneuraminate synthase family protein n=1 Tax=unclassified Thalassospira TaxID=2648997 RepID=UPI00399B3DC0
MSCEIIAEIGQNHNGDMDLAVELIRTAAKAGAEVAKFQLYDAKSLFPTKEQGNEWYDYNCATELSFEQVCRLKDVCDEVGVEFMASPFDVERVEWLEKLGVKRYKVASRSIRNSDLINAIVATGKPIISSLGLWAEPNFPKIGSTGQTRFLYCVAKYPTPLSDLNFSEVQFSDNGFAGFSDHTIGVTAPIVAISRGAKIVEKHFTLDPKMTGPDHLGSMTPDELQRLVSARNEISVCLGSRDGAGIKAENSFGESFVLQL